MGLSSLGYRAGLRGSLTTNRVRAANDGTVPSATRI